MLAGSLATLESATLGDDAVEGVVLRYGSFYGAGTYFAPGGLYASMIVRRLLPIPGDGGGLFGFVHIDDAVSATVAALHGPTGVFNVVDDVPARARSGSHSWPGCSAPRRRAGSPKRWRGVGAGKFVTYLMCDQPAVSNRRVRSELGWVPRYPDWHDGLRAALAPD